MNERRHSMTSSGRVHGMTAIVTGAASERGMGFGIARLLAQEGARVVIGDIDARVLDRAEALRSDGLAVDGAVQDVTKEADWQRLFDLAGPSVDILVNAAAIAILGPIETLTIEQFERQIHVNLSGAFIGTRMAITAMRDHGEGGSIVNIGALGATVGMPNGAAYSASKGGLLSLTKTVALECARDRIRCNIVHPGMVDTEMLAIGWRDNPEGMKAFINAIPLGHMGVADDIAHAALYLASRESRFVTGIELFVDGGASAQ